ncbi:MAG: efflux RND transporter periplasmic adaptor subunit [Bacteroides sp.]|nr:efflux RND transporter periplasmic adaptor subunit [Bacteroides sp.]MCM1413378.1 efflux RND transporter periplasmic adaptor subunit [Bacteroides sp.]MCM1471936.1 efflux RND transporter periplasmic adaptor subunit [Bacteroides sp.]
MKTQYYSALAVVATLAATAMMAGCSKNKPVEEQLQSIDVAVPIVDSVVLHRSYPGFLKSAKTVDVVGRVNGTLQSNPYKAGDKVQAGQVLFTIDPTTYRDAVTKAEAALATARSEYEYASKEYEAMKKALESDAVSRMEVVQAESNMKTAAAAISTAQAALNIARTNLGYCTVRAPISGEITDAVYSSGNYIAGEGSPVVLATIYDNSQLHANFEVDDDQYMKIMADRQSADVSTDYSHIPLTFEEPLPHSYTADLFYTAPTINKSTGTILFEALVDNKYNELRNGMYMTIKLPYGFDRNAVMVKDASISTDQRGKYLYTVTDSNTVAYTPIEVGELVNDTLRIVTKGIKPGQRYVTKAMMKVRDGMKIKPVMKK